MTSEARKLVAAGFVFGVVWTLFVINALKWMHVKVWQ